MSAVKKKTKKKKNVERSLTAVLSKQEIPIGYGALVVRGSVREHRVQNSEIITSVVNVTPSWSVGSSVVIQPGTFKWLGPIASRYETYKVNKLVFTFHPTTSTYSSGSVSMLWDPDVRDPEPSSMEELAANRYTTFGACYERQKLEITDQRSLNPMPFRFTRIGAPQAPIDLKTYDCGKLIVGSDGIAATYGYIMMTYDITLYDPNNSEGIGDITSFVPVSNGTDTGLGAAMGAIAGKVPFVVDDPTSVEIAAGAKSGMKLLRFMAPFEGILRSTFTGTAVNGIPGSASGSNVTHSLVNGTLNTSGTQAELTDRVKYKGEDKEGTNWFQSFMPNALFTTATEFQMLTASAPYTALY